LSLQRDSSFNSSMPPAILVGLRLHVVCCFCYRERGPVDPRWVAVPRDPKLLTFPVNDYFYLSNVILPYERWPSCQTIPHLRSCQNLPVAPRSHCLTCGMFSREAAAIVRAKSTMLVVWEARQHSGFFFCLSVLSEAFRYPGFRYSPVSFPPLYSNSFICPSAFIYGAESAFVHTGTPPRKLLPAFKS